MRKRKAAFEEEATFQKLEGQIKKIRITYSPGELRLSKDVLEATRLNTDLFIRMTDDPSIAAIDFPAVPGPLLIPNKFYVKVPKFYPHNGPVVQCVDIASYYPNHFFDELGHVTHPLLTTQWTALYTLNTVVQVLREIREMLQTGKLYKMSYEDDSTMEEES